jgi:hypothetical protein
MQWGWFRTHLNAFPVPAHVHFCLLERPQQPLWRRVFEELVDRGVAMAAVWHLQAPCRKDTRAMMQRPRRMKDRGSE